MPCILLLNQIIARLSSGQKIDEWQTDRVKADRLIAQSGSWIPWQQIPCLVMEEEANLGLLQQAEVPG